MKMLIIGASCFGYNDKKTGEARNMLVLHSVKNSANCYGKAVEEIIINGSSSLYAKILGTVNGVSSNLVGYFVSVDRNIKGYVEELELLEKSDDAVVWGF